MASYLVHFNRNHDKKSGKFTYGDGDGDGITNDHANQRASSFKRAADGYRNLRDSHRQNVLETETYRTNRDNLRLRQDQIANQRNKEKSNIKTRNEDVRTQKAQAAAEREKIKNAREQERQRAAIEKEKQRREIQEEKARSAEARAREALAKKQRQAEQNAEKDLLRMENEQRRAERQAAKDAKKFQKQQDKLARAEQEAYNAQINRNSKRAGALVAAVAGRPLTAINTASPTAGSLLGVQALRLLPLGGFIADAASASIIKNSIKKSSERKAAQQYYNYQ